MLAQAVAVLLVALASDTPFADLAYEAALAQAKEQQKLLFVDFTASWCGPCKKMEAETWPAAEVVTWLGEHAISIQVDVDKQRELAQKFKIKAMPTVVALRGGEEFDRIVGYKDAAGFLAWARDVAAGKRSSDELMERAKNLAESDDVEARYDLADDLLTAGHYELALEHYLWVWPASRKSPAMAGVRLSFMLSEMAELAREYPPAKEAFMEILDGLQAQVNVDGLPESQAWREWWSMCEYFDLHDRMMNWYESHRDAEGRLFAERTNDPEVQRITGKVFEVLIEQNRGQDAVRLLGDASVYAADVVKRFERLRAPSEAETGEMRTQLEKFARDKLTKDLSMLFAALLSAGRREEAVEVGELLISTLDTPEARLALVSAGAEVAQGPEESFGRWLDEAEAAGANVKLLRRKLDRLAETKPTETKD
jgi:thiol-disulfide isomerase/thioredoxin